MLLNIHTPTHSFALPYRQGESFDVLLTRITHKAGIPSGDAVKAVREGREGSGLRYEFDGGRWMLGDGAFSLLFRAFG
jgi:hypothetical protein